MKKILALVLALTMSLTLGVTALAVDADADDLANVLFGGPDGSELSIYSYALVDSADDKLDPGPPASSPSSSHPDNNDAIKSGSKLYLGISNNFDWDLDNDDVKIKISKEEGGKYVSSVKLVQKKLTNKVYLTDQVSWSDRGRSWYLEVGLREFMTDDEFKISFKLTATKKGDFGFTSSGTDYTFKNGLKCSVTTEPFWVTNKVLEGDQDQMAGTRGIVFKPEKNEDNEVIWEDENDQIAKLSFTADSDVAKYYPKLSTKWDNSKYEEKFADQDAFIRQFVGSPKISSTSRATLELNVPYLDDDNELTVDENEIIIYEETADGELIDITSKGKFVTNDDDDFVFQMKTRQLGTYIFAAAPAAEAETENIPEEAPEADKANPGTGF
ncbi:hypothetical protein DWV16_04920 [Anaerotruncus sp. AF02-27]|uniref:hypothetical protein n=1 Tax=Anaerotruncus TaxID=244127 RepID=UPI000E481C90|nr:MULTISPECIES: hypothetical protein [Anaerotruncus]RGX56407.1 hypothetical protein DWV16_04920 [Anaerotruncus sp. AF02-27]